MRWRVSPTTSHSYLGREPGTRQELPSAPTSPVPWASPFHPFINTMPSLNPTKKHFHLHLVTLASPALLLGQMCPPLPWFGA